MIRLLKDNVNTKEHWKEVYDDHGPGIALVQRERYVHIARHIENIECRVVDLGCGTGVLPMLMRAMRPGMKITGVDLYGGGKDFTVTPTSDGVEGKPIKLFENFVEGDVCDTGLPSDNYDYVISAETLEHVDDPQKMVNEMYRILKPSGRALLTTPLSNRLPSGEHVWSFELEDVRDMFIKAGFRRVWVCPYSSGSVGVGDAGDLVNPEGTWDTCWAMASKGGFI